MIKIVILIITLSGWAAASTVDNQGHNEWPECGSEEILHRGSFSPYDYSAVGFMLAVSLGIGVFYGYFVKPKKDDADPNSNDFLLGSGMTVFPVTLSLTTSFITAIELLGNPSEMFFSGTQYALIVISALLVIPVATKIFFPIYYKMNLTSCYEYLGVRFDNKLRVFGAVLYILQMSFYTSVAVLAPAIALSKATGLDTHVAVVLIYFVCIFYSSQGGMKAVVIADTFQACVLALSLVLVVAFGWYYTGGPAEIFSRAEENGRIELFNLSTNPTTRHSVYSVIIGGFFYWTSLFCTNQASVQKCMSLKSLKKANITICSAILGLVLVFLFNFYTGLMTYAHYAGCDPLRAGMITEKDQLVPFYVMDVLGHVKFMTGIFVAGIFAASLGTVAAALNSLSAVTCEDLLVTGFGMKIPQEKASLYAKWMSLGYGVLSFGLVFVVERLGGILQATLTLNGLIGGVTLGLFSLGIFFRSANSKGALYGGILSMAFVIYIGIMAQINGVPVTPLPSSLDTCNCTQSSSVPSILDHSRELPFDNPVSVALVDLGPNGGLSTAAGGYRVFPAANSMEIMTRSTQDDSPLAAVYHISYMWYSFLGTFLTILFGFIISLMTGGLCLKKQMSTNLLPTTLRGPKQDEKCLKALSYRKSVEDTHPPSESLEKGRKSITKDSTIRIQIGAPLTMMMKTSVSSSDGKKQQQQREKELEANGSIPDEGNIFSIEGYCNQLGEDLASELPPLSVQVCPGKLAVKVERERF
ncbi:sodium-coupled monocarboxylate transporter 1 [Toxorhynchites rutilus septentrionalis]|uniref:sodium-coupled monocarboxylate transporter 1 n=1 Tax=Toxorhynchites rutilus septentrionalis TaxID=329112 RepID=UPI00247A5593|nr:sodium-coupled monocarboxylate transporter 1 [Toxorhynchites rutilus septentrionalis]